MSCHFELLYALRHVRITLTGRTHWYLKWVSSALVLSAMSIRGIPELQQLDLILSIFGISGWVGVSIAWKDRALIMLNTVGLFFLLRNLITIWVQ